MKSEAKNPALKMRVLHVTGAGRKVVRVQHENKSLTIGGETWKCTQDHIFPGKPRRGAGKWDAICVEGQSEALPVWRSSPVTAVEYNDAVNDNLLIQQRINARGIRTPKSTWFNMSLQGLTLLVVIITYMALSGDMEELRNTMFQLWQDARGAGGDVTRVGN